METQVFPLRHWVASDIAHGRFRKKDVALLEKALISSESDIVDCVTSHFLTTHDPESTSDDHSTWIVHDLKSGPSEFQVSDVSNGSLHPFGISDSWILAYLVLEDQEEFGDIFGGSNEARLYLLDRSHGTVEQVGTWDLNLRGLYTSRHGPKVAHLGCTISGDEKWVITLGPSNVFRGPSDGCKVMNMEHKCFVQDIKIPGYMKVAKASFDPRPGQFDMVCLVCCRRHEICTDYSRPNTSGDLVIYKITTSEVLQSFSTHAVSSEILTFSPDGEFILARSNKDKAILIFDSKHLCILRTLHHDVSKFRPNHFAFTSLYQFFPLFSACSSKVAVLNCHEVLPVGVVDHDSSLNRVRSFHNVYVKSYTLPVKQMFPLKYWCRRTIRAFATDHHDVSTLPLPQVLKDFLLWNV